MSNELIVRPKTEIAPQAKKKDILELYGVPAMMDRVIEKERVNLLKAFGLGSGAADAINRMAHSQDFIVEIPSGLRKLIEEGKAKFDNSKKMPGAFTPNVRGEEGQLIGQAVIAERVDPVAVTESLSNLGMMAMVQSVMSQLDVIDKKLDEIKQGQEDDRVAGIIGSFKSFMDMYPGFKTQDQLMHAAITANDGMQKGLAKLHLQIEREREKVYGAPGDWWGVMWEILKSLFGKDAPVKEYQKAFNSFVYDIQLYNRLMLLSDFVKFLSGDKGGLSANHKQMVEYCNQWLDDKFMKRMEFLGCETEEITNILRFNENHELALDRFMADDLLIECKQDEIKHLNITQDGNRTE